MEVHVGHDFGGLSAVARPKRSAHWGIIGTRRPRVRGSGGSYPAGDREGCKQRIVPLSSHDGHLPG